MNDLIESSQKERIYLRDWYYNAGIVGFLKIVCDGNFEKIDDFSDKLYIGEDYIEFDLSILDSFEEKFYKQLFLNYFNLNQYKAYINKALKDEKVEQTDNISKILKDIDRFPFEGLHDYLGYKLENYQNILDYKEKIDEFTKEQIYDWLKATKFVEDYVVKTTKGIVTLTKLGKYLRSVQKHSFELIKNSDKPCISCQTRKKEFELSNAISNIIGFNPDNSNWIWGFNSTKVQLCSICSLIYLSASVSLIFHKKANNKRANEYSNYFYFINHNRNVYELVKSYNTLKIQVDKIKNQEIYPVMVKETIRFMRGEQAQNSLKNISFIEIQENDMGGKSTKSYNVYSFSLSEKLAEFIDKNLDKIPRGNYNNIKKIYFDIEYEILRKTIEKKLYYNDIDNYTRLYLLSKNNGTLIFNSNINMIVNYILNYIFYMLKGGKMDLEKISKKGFANGIQLRKEFGKERENQINGLAYQFLNDLKVADRDKFLDKYLRISISNKLESRFGQDELNSKEAFLHFGYSFINGLLNTYDREREQK